MAVCVGMEVSFAALRLGPSWDAGSQHDQSSMPTAAIAHGVAFSGFQPEQQAQKSKPRPRFSLTVAIPTEVTDDSMMDAPVRWSRSIPAQTPSAPVATTPY